MLLNQATFTNIHQLCYTWFTLMQCLN